MKTRKQSEVGGKGESAGTLNDISQDAVGKGLMRANANSVRIRKNDNVHQCQTIEPESGSRNSKRKSIGDSECYSKYKESSASSRMKGNAEREEEMDESDWEDGPSHTLDSRDNYSNDQIKEVTIEFNALPDSSKRKPVHRASAEDKEVAELVHKVHLLCLLARGRIIDNACDDPLIQASLLSILPKYLMRISNVQKLSPKDLAPLVSWFHENFHVKGPCTRERLYPSALAYALERREGTPEEVAALSVALFRALNFTTRFVSILDVASLKPESSNEAVIKSVQGIFSSSTPMVHRTNMVSTTSKISSCHDEENTYARDGPKRKNWASGKTNEPATSHTSDQLMDGILDSLATGSPNSTKETPKRKGDFEFEMQLEMALAATATGGLEDNMNSELSNADNGASNFLSLGKRLKRNKSDELSASSRGISTAIGSKKVGSPLYWAEVYFNGENLTGKWVHVDAVNAIIDGENNVEAAAAACKTSLRYAVAFAGHGAKDVTRRYCMKWYKISSQRISLSWWDSVLAPLKALESGATTGLVNVPRESGIESLEEDFKNSYAESSVMNSLTDTRTSLEDLELETRALTEPLPTNQQAYKNHHLYALERWLTKHQTLHPKGPVLGFCSGHPVYPRTCVQTLQTKERWLREGLQPKSDELPTKVLRRPHKLKMVEVDDIEGDCGESIALYGKWQMEPLFLPRAVNGIVPRVELIYFIPLSNSFPGNCLRLILKLSYICFDEHFLHDKLEIESMSKKYSSSFLELSVHIVDLCLIFAQMCDLPSYETYSC